MTPMMMSYKTNQYLLILLR